MTSPRRMWARLPIGLAAMLAVSGCSNDTADGDATSPTVRTETTPPTTRRTSAATDVARMPTDPAQIDEAYLEAVMGKLDVVWGDMVRALVSARAPNADYFQRLTALYAEPEFSRVRARFGQLAADGLTVFRPEPGDAETDVTEVLSASTQCVYFSARRTFGPALVTPPAEDETSAFLALRPKDPVRDPSGHNPTAWALVLDGATATGQPPEDPCR